MYKNELLESLKNESSFIDENSLLEQYNTFILETKEDEIISPAKRLLKYNMETMIELKNKFLGKNENELINDENIEMLKSSINNYMDKYAEWQNDQKISYV
jgi:hypothetical protein